MSAKSELMDLTSALDFDAGRTEVVNAASSMCAMLKTQEISLSMAEKLTVIKSVTRAKVRAFRHGQEDNFKTFKTLDTISNDLVQLL